MPTSDQSSPRQFSPRPTSLCQTPAGGTVASNSTADSLTPAEMVALNSNTDGQATAGGMVASNSNPDSLTAELLQGMEERFEALMLVINKQDLALKNSPSWRQVLRLQSELSRVMAENAVLRRPKKTLPRRPARERAGAGECCVCWERTAVMAAVQCGHMSMCEGTWRPDARGP